MIEEASRNESLVKSKRTKNLSLSESQLVKPEI